MFSLGQTLTPKSFHCDLLVFFDRTKFFESNEHFFQKLELLLELQRANREFSGNHGHNILKLYNVLIHARLSASKMKRDIQYRKLGIRVAERLKSQDLRKYQENLKFGWSVKAEIFQVKCKCSPLSEAARPALNNLHSDKVLYNIEKEQDIFQL